jgi:hypothetical protein
VSRATRDRSSIFTLGVVAVAVLGIGSVHGKLADAHQHVKETSDVYVLPPPNEVVLLSLGYRSALVDLLWSHVLVSQGLHTFDKRRFDNLSLFLDAINTLEPTFRDPYLLADALFTFQTSVTPEAEIRKAREVMERGAAALPLDGEVWLTLGQFVAFVAPTSYLSDPKEQEQWRLDGARMLAHAAELGGGNASIQWLALGGASIFHRAGEREAEIAFRRRALAVTDDPELKERIQKQLGVLLGEEQVERDRRRFAKLSEIHKKDLPFIKSITRYHVLGPPIDMAACTGPEHADELGCATTWRAWAERLDEQAPR